MRQPMLALAAASLIAIVLASQASLVHAADEPLTILVRFYPAAGREDELQARLTKLRDFVQTTNPRVTYKVHRSETVPTVFLVYETFPSQAAVDDLAKTVFPAFQKEHGPIPAGIVVRPVEREIFRAITD
jgi:quinol monooxygenase YgiN